MKHKSHIIFIIAFMLVCALQSQTIAATLYWDGNDTSADADGGSGNWSDLAAVLNWDSAATGGSAKFWTSGDSAVFGGTPGTVTLDASQSAATITFEVNGYVLDTAGNNLNLSLLAGTGSFTKAGAGTLAVTSNGSAYTGKITVNSGVLQTSNSNFDFFYFVLV